MTDFLDELGNFKQKKFTLQNVIVFYILKQQTLGLFHIYVLTNGIFLSDFFFIDFLDELGNFKQKKFTLQKVKFYILKCQGRTTQP